VTRLIASGLREGGLRTFAKTTGTLPRVILDDGSEYPVYRQGRTNIIEQIRIVSFAALNNAQALVIECMALQPYLQFLSEHKMIKSTHGVIVNAREDHLDIMGPTEREVVLSLLGTTPENAVLFTCERDYPGEFEEVAKQRNTKLITISDSDIAEITEQDLGEFKYVEHRENVALALKVCQGVGLDREVALRGIKKSEPDVGAMSDLRLDFFGRQIQFVNGFAANDPESSEMIWNMSIKKHPEIKRRIMVINCRHDRPDRSVQLGKAIPNWPKADQYIIIGSGAYFFIKTAVKEKMDARIFNNAEGLDTENIFEEIISYCPDKSLVVGLGNIAGPGLELLKFFKNRATVNKL
jgi:poly-gamma-glutamate synthase PgsB/CapB